jgi:hypothetical protein
VETRPIRVLTKGGANVGRVSGPRSGPEMPGGLGRLGQAHVYSLEPLWALLKIELHSLALLQRAESVHLDRGVVHEYIGPAIGL